MLRRMKLTVSKCHRYKKKKSNFEKERVLIKIHISLFLEFFKQFSSNRCAYK